MKTSFSEENYKMTAARKRHAMAMKSRLAAACECFASDQRKEGISAIDDTDAENSDTSETSSHEFEYVRFHHRSFQKQSLRSTVSLWSNFYHMLRGYQW